jgi:hypothetical protein
MRAHMIDHLQWVRGQWRVQYKVPPPLHAIAGIKTQTRPTGVRGARDDKAAEARALAESHKIIARMQARQAAWERELRGEAEAQQRYIHYPDPAFGGFVGARITKYPQTARFVGGVEVPMGFDLAAHLRQTVNVDAAASPTCPPANRSSPLPRRGTTSPKARQAMSRCMNKLAVFLGHSDASRVKADDLAGFPDWLLKSGLKPKTVGDDYVPAAWNTPAARHA